MSKKLFLIMATEIMLIFIIASIYVAIQQDIRQSANDLPKELAQNAQNALNNKVPAEQVISYPKIELNNSLSAFIIVVDKNNKVLATDATLDGADAQPPVGVYQYAKEKGINKITWQPKDGIRESIVVLQYQGGYIVSGHSLQPFEDRTDNILKLLLIGLALGTIVNVFVVLIYYKLK